MKAVAECLAHSSSEETKEDARALLEALAKSNPRYEMQIYKGIIHCIFCIIYLAVAREHLRVWMSLSNPL